MVWSLDKLELTAAMCFGNWYVWEYGIRRKLIPVPSMETWKKYADYEENALVIVDPTIYV